MTTRLTDSPRQGIKALADGLGNLLVDAFHYLALFAIGAATVWSAVVAFHGMAAKGHASIDDILLLFIYLELGAMVGIYFKTNHMPVRFLIYVAMTALTRMMISDIQAHHQPQVKILYIPAAILVLALATLVVRYGSAWFRGVQARYKGQIRAGGVVKDVTFVEETSTDINDKIDSAYLTKYRRYPTYVAPMVTAEARAATIKLVP